MNGIFTAFYAIVAYYTTSCAVLQARFLIDQPLVMFPLPAGSVHTI
jgi:hypothetical protein